MASTRVSSKGQMTTRKRVREALALRQGTELPVEAKGIAGMLAHRGKRMSPKRERTAILAAVLAEDERSKRKARRRP